MTYNQSTVKKDEVTYYSDIYNQLKIKDYKEEIL